MNRSESHPPTDAELSRLLHVPRPPDWLQARLLRNLDEQVKQGQRHGIGRLVLGLSLAANIVFAVVLFAAYREQPTLTMIAMAHEHLVLEHALQGSFDGVYPGWLNAHRVGVPPSGFSLSLAKNCRVGGLEVKHLRFTSETQGTINLLLYHPAAEGLVSLPDEGRFAGQRWFVMEPRSGMAMLVFADEDTTIRQVNGLLGSMFPEFEAVFV